MPGFGFGQSPIPLAANPQDAWKPSAWDIFMRAAAGNGDLGAAATELRNQHTAQLFAQEDNARMHEAAATPGLTAINRAGMLHDPNSFATNANQSFGFHTVAGGDRGVAGGVDLGTAPKISSPAETTTANAAGAKSAADASEAATKAGKLALETTMNPVEMLLKDRQGRAALIAAAKQSGGGGGGFLNNGLPPGYRPVAR